MGISRWSPPPTYTVIQAINSVIDQDNSDLKFVKILSTPNNFSISDINGVAGDANYDGIISILDVVYLITYLFKFGPSPYPYWTGDANGDCKVSLSDIVWLINYLFKSGPAPTCNTDC